MKRQFMTEEQAIAAIKQSILDGSFREEMIENLQYQKADTVIYFNFDTKVLEDIGSFALAQNKKSAFDVLASNQTQKNAEKLQLVLLRKEIDENRTPNFNLIFTAKVTKEISEEKTGYMSGSQDHGDKHVRTETVDESFNLNQQSKVELVNYALQQNKPDMAKQMVVQLPSDALSVFSDNDVLGDTVRNEINTRQHHANIANLKQELRSLKTEIETLKTIYEGRGSLSRFLLNPTTREKITEVTAMLSEITRLNDLFDNKPNNKAPWQFDANKVALKDRDRLFKTAEKLNTLKNNITKLVQPTATVSAAARSN